MSGLGRYPSYSNDQHGGQSEVDRGGNVLLYKPQHNDAGRRYNYQQQAPQSPATYVRHDHADLANSRFGRSTSYNSNLPSRAYNPLKMQPFQDTPVAGNTHSDTNSLRNLGNSPQQRPLGSTALQQQASTGSQPQVYIPQPNFLKPISSYDQQFNSSLRMNHVNTRVQTDSSVDQVTRSLNTYGRPGFLNDSSQGRGFIQNGLSVHPMNSMNVQLAAKPAGEREFSPSPLQRGFRNNLVSPGLNYNPQAQGTNYNPQAMNYNQQVMNSQDSRNNPMLASGNMQNSMQGGYHNMTASGQHSGMLNSPQVASSGRFQMSTALNRGVPGSPGLNPQHEALDNHESRMNAVARERERMKALGTQKQMMESLLDQKFKDFKNTINRNLKERFDTELKRALFHLWKHYKNCNERHMSHEDIEKSIYENLRKVYIETNELKEKNKSLADQVKIKEIETTDIINRQIKENSLGTTASSPKEQMDPAQPMDINQRKRALETQISNLKSESVAIERQIKELQEGKQNRLYEAKLHLEKQGRETMDEYSHKLAVEYCPSDSQELAKMKQELIKLSSEYEAVKQQWIDSGCGPNPTDYKIRLLEQEHFDLEKQLESLKH